MPNVWEIKIGSEPLLADTDGDGIPDGLEVNLKNQTLYDHDKDGRPDILDADDDGDGIPSVYEGMQDTDKDGLANYLDVDSDGDGILDRDEVSLSLSDKDHDRIDDRFDSDTQDGEDKNGDGILDQVALADENNNGIPDYLDRSIRNVRNRSNTVLASHNKTPPYELSTDKKSDAPVVYAREESAPDQISNDDLDGDGLSNEVELALGLNPRNNDSDGDGVNDLIEVGVDLQKPQNSDLDAFIDALDPDDDNDGILTRLEIQTSKTMDYQLDTDNDGVANYLDANDDGDSLLSKAEGYTEDSDKDGIPDYLDSDDGVLVLQSAEIVVLYDKSGSKVVEANKSHGSSITKSMKVVTSK